MRRPAPSAMRPLLALLLVATAGCDAFGDDIRPLTDVLVVDLVAAAPAHPVPLLSLVTEGAPGCAPPIAFESRSARGVLTIDVEGLDETSALPCRALVPSGFVVALPVQAGGLTVDVRHRGRTDRYRIGSDAQGPTLAAVRTSVTRPGPRCVPSSPTPLSSCPASSPSS